MSDGAKYIVANYINIPVMMITPKSAILDEMSFIPNKIADNEKAIFELAVIIQQ